MVTEARQSPSVVREQLKRNAPLMTELAARFRAHPPRVIATIARGSSDNAATYAQYLLETRLGVLTTSSAPSVSSVYGASPDMEGTLVLAISQSGRSPDLLAASRSAQEAGATVVAIVNDESSPLSELALAIIPVGAGTELSVAATKSFIATLTAIAQFTATWSDDSSLLAALDQLPETLAAAWELDWSDAVEPLAAAEHLFVVGRGLNFGIAQEAALKFKETCGLHAEAFSTAEVQHGPMTLVGRDFPVLAFFPDDDARTGVEESVSAFRKQGATVLAVGGRGEGALPIVDCHPLLLPIAQIQAFYRMLDEVAARRGRNPDAPPYLAKVTETL
jgi:glucosamine--fructose-6-phosphate aminotransferase (isomerizing)